MIRVAVLSDTHGLLRRTVVDRLKGCACILHAGDVISQSDLDELAVYGSLYAVRGNCDMWQRGVSDLAQPAPTPPQPEGWTCACGKTGITSNFCPDCGSKKPEPPKPWTCACGQTGITSKFCPNCGGKRPETWDCACGRKGIASRFCPDCGRKREE